MIQINHEMHHYLYCIEIIVLIGVVGRISWIDLQTFRIPDHWNTILFLVGIVYRLPFGFDAVALAISFSALTFAVLWSVRWFHSVWTGSIGLGLGDVKFVAAAATWLDASQFSIFLLLASGSAFSFAVCRSLPRGNLAELRNTRVPFGPFLGFGLLVTFLTGAGTTGRVPLEVLLPWLFV